jgi:hypothetical protein
VNKTKQFLAAALAVATLAGTSAFAESRPSNETRRRDGARDTVRRERSSSTPRGDVSRNTQRTPTGVTQRSERSREGRTYDRGDRSRTDRSRTDRSREGRTEGRTYERGDRSRSDRSRTDRSREGRTYERNDRNDRNRGSDRNRSGGTWDRNRGGSSSRGSGTYRRDDSRSGSQHRSYGGSHGNRQHYHHRGRISHHQRYGNGYRVWVIGAPYPFFVPLSHWHRDRFRIGLTIGIGGYYNPGGYYDYYDGYDAGYRSTSRGVLRGVVESVDYRRDTFVVRNEATGSFVTVHSRDRRDDVRAGDFVELSGDWTRSGVFTAYDVDLLDSW